LRVSVPAKRRDLGLGSVQEVSLAEKAVERRKVARQGKDPTAQLGASLTFKEAEKVHTLRKATWRNSKHRDQWINATRLRLPQDRENARGRYRARERAMTDRANIEGRLENMSPWHMLEHELRHVLHRHPKLRAKIEAGKAEWAKRRKSTLSDAERARLADVLSSGAGRDYGLARFLRGRG
jgi:hypothetical protein